MKKLLFIALAFMPFLSFTLFAQDIPAGKIIGRAESSSGAKDPHIVFAPACPTPVFDVSPNKVLNCNSTCATLTVRDSANLSPKGSMTPGWRWTISNIDNGICSDARLEVWSSGVLRAAIGNNTIGTTCAAGCNYLGTWSAFFGTCVTGGSYTIIQEKQTPTATTEVRMYYPTSNSSFLWSMNDNFTNAVAASGTFNFASVTTGYLTSGVHSKTTGINQGTATFVCPTCPAASWTDFQNGTARFCPAQATPGKYACTYSFSSGSCSKSYTDTITVNSINNASWTSPGSICANASYNLNSYLSGSATPGGTWTGTNVSGNTFSPTGSGTVSITYSVGTTACKVAQTNIITVLASPTVAVTPPGPNTYCAGTPVSLMLTASGASTYAWNTAQTTSSITVNPVTSATYTVVGTSAQGCNNTATVAVNFTPLPSISSSVTAASCAGGNGSITATVTSGTSPFTYLWSNGNTTSAISALAGTYSLTVTDASGCTGTQTATISQPPAITASVSTTSTTILAGESATLSATGGSTYSWTPTTGLSNTTIANPVASPALTTKYCVTVNDANGCTDSACVTVYVNDNCKEFSIPNAFSPNADNKNDKFRPLPVGCFKDMDFSIYNRWGNLMFSTTDVTQGWNGSSPDGKECTDGVYFYKLKATFINGTAIDQNGTVTLLK